MQNWAVLLLQKTPVYSHVLPSLQQDAMNKISDLFNQHDA